jgi:hypothetical protein
MEMRKRARCSSPAVWPVYLRCLDYAAAGRERATNNLRRGANVVGVNPIEEIGVKKPSDGRDSERPCTATPD